MNKVVSINIGGSSLKNLKSFNAFIWLGKNFIQSALSDEKNRKILSLEAFEKENGNITGQEALRVLQSNHIQNARHVYVGVESKKFTLMPKALYLDNKRDLYLSECYTIEKNEQTKRQELSSLAIESIFTIKKGTEQLLRKELKHLTVLHGPSALLHSYKSYMEPSNRYASFVRLQQDEVFISIFKEKKLYLHKSYEIDCLEDAYYLYFDVLRQLNIERKQMALYISGNHPDASRFNKTMQANLKAAQLMKKNSLGLQYDAKVLEQPLHQFQNLFALLSCA